MIAGAAATTRRRPPNTRRPERETMELEQALFDPRQWPIVYGTTPPRADTDTERIERAARRLAERVRGLPLNGLVVYDVQDERERTAEPRPFPYLPTIDSRRYAHLLRQVTGLTPLTYKCVAAGDAAAWSPWLTETRAIYDLSYLSLVGRPSSRGQPPTLPLQQAIRQAATHPGRFTLGGVVIAERHRPERSESLRVLQKAEAGCRYFISQAVYRPEPTIAFLQDYLGDCRARGRAPSRVILTFVPCGRSTTMAFIRWLGIALSDQTARAILDDPAPLSRSIRICCSHLRVILDHVDTTALPLGLNVESVSIHRDEIDASIDLVHALRAVINEHH